jgi:hypothetical protein
MKILFLDVDGVLNTQRYITRKDRQFIGRKHLAKLEWEVEQIDPARISMVNQIVQETGCKVVVSSTWRKLHSIEELDSLFRILGAEFSIFDYTHILGTRRGFEIQEWLDENPQVDRFVILDDDSDMEHLTPYLVRTRFIGDETEAGLQQSHMQECIDKLNNQDMEP